MSLTIHLQHFQARVLQDALTEATANYWQHRAQQFADVGTEQCDLIAENCRHHAELLRSLAPEPISTEVTDALQELT